MIGAFKRMSKGILSHLGEDALFRGALSTKINIQHGVEFAGTDGDGAAYKGDYTAQKDVATIDSALSPKRTDTFQFLSSDDVPGSVDLPVGKRYRLEKLFRDNGVNQQFIVLEIP